MSSKQIGKYTVSFKLGQGAMGVVYKAIDTETKQEVAIKILSEELIHNEEAIGRFKREIRQALQLEHPNIVRSLDHGIFQDRHYYVMEFVSGCTIKELLKRQGTFKEYQAVAIVLQVIQGLEYAENYGIVHSDIKPENIMFSSNQTVKISDMGLAKSQDSATKVTVKGTVLGTPQYMAPEQATGKEKIDHRADIYSLGASFYHMLAGNPPFMGKNPIQVLSKVLSSEPPSIRSIRPDISEKTEGILKKMMAKNLELRYQHCSEVKRDLEALKAILKPCELPEVILAEELASVANSAEPSAGPITKKIQEKSPPLNSAPFAEVPSTG
ncbi:MAG: serine/threonine-protein kinase, partial [Planctomycetota bacterium]